MYYIAKKEDNEKILTKVSDYVTDVTIYDFLNIKQIYGFNTYRMKEAIPKTFRFKIIANVYCNSMKRDDVEVVKAPFAVGV